MTHEPRRIAYLISQYPTLSMIFIIREVVTLIERGFEVEVASINEPDRPDAEMTEVERTESARTYYIKSQGSVAAVRAHVATLIDNPSGYRRGVTTALRFGRFDLRGLVYAFAYLTEALLVGRWMDDNDLDHVHSHLGSQPSTVAVLVAAVFGHGFSMTVHGPDEFYDAERQHLREKVEAADFVVCISDFARSQLAKLSDHEHWHKLVVARLGVDTDQFAPRPPPADDGFEVICVGRLTPAKGQHVLLDALRRLLDDGRDVRLRLVGDGVDRASLEAHAAALDLGDHVVFEGAVNQDHIRALYRQASAFCIPSFAEGIPVVLMEAMAMEIPCVTTRITGIPELITDGVDGLLVPASNVDALADALARLIDDPQAARTMGRRGRETVCARYDLDVNVGHLAEIFASRL